MKGNQHYSCLFPSLTLVKLLCVHERLGAGGEGDDRGWDVWMASPTQWTWVWVGSRSWWWTGRPRVLQFMGSQSRTRLSDWTELMLSLQSCLTLCSLIDCSPPGFSVHGILQARILEWVAISSSKGSSRPRDWTRNYCITGGFFTTEPPAKPKIALHPSNISATSHQR